MDTHEYDLVVVGGGPAGAAAAKASVDGGLRTLLIEKKKIPRHKPCSGYIFSEALSLISERFGPLPDAVRCEPPKIKGIRILLPGGNLLSVDIEGESVWRNRFDEWLCRRSGAEIWDRTRLADFAEWRDQVELICRRDGEDMKIRAKAMVAASGAYSMVTKRIDPDFFKGVLCVNTNQRYYSCKTDLDPGCLHVFINPEYGVYPAAYVKDDLLVTDISVNPGKDIRIARDSFHRMLRGEHGFSPERIVMNLASRQAFPSASNRFCFGTNRVLIAGEAAGFVNAMGEGISSALATGFLAAEALLRCGDSPPCPVYRETVKKERERTVREWLLPYILTGRARPELKNSMFRLSPLRLIRVSLGLLSWLRAGGIAPGIDRKLVVLTLRRLLEGDYNYRA